MPAVFEKLAIAQHMDTLRHAIIRGGGYRPSIHRLHVGDYVYLQQIAPATLDVTTGHTILQVQEVLAFRILMLEGRDGVVWKELTLLQEKIYPPCSGSHFITESVSRICAPCHLPNVDGTVDPSLAMVRVGLKCMLCGSRGGADHMLVCDRCSRGWHMAYMTPPMDVVPVGWWVCPRYTLEG